MSQPSPSSGRSRSPLLPIALILVGASVCACLAGGAITLFDLLPIANSRGLGQVIGQLIGGLLLLAIVLVIIDRVRKRR
jgi:hypothetical protein